jgi:hypothetical protein
VSPPIAEPGETSSGSDADPIASRSSISGHQRLVRTSSRRDDEYSEASLTIRPVSRATR